MEFIPYFLSISIILQFLLMIVWIFRSKNEESKIVTTLQEEKNNLRKTNSELIEKVQKIQQSQTDQLNDMSRTIIEVSEKMTELQVNLQNVIDSKLKSQSDEFKKDLNKVNNKVDTILGLVMECDNENCPTKRKVSNYLKNQNQYDK